MNAREKAEFAALLADMAALYGRDITPGVVDLYCAALSGHSIKAIRLAMSEHIRDQQAGKFMPKPADLLAKLQGNDGRPSAEEAWAMVPLDDGPSVVWTDEIAEASGAVAGLLAARDTAGARMAFRDAYERLVARARAERRPVRWWLSRGHDRSDDERAVRAAVAAGRITDERASVLLPAIRYAPPPEVARIAGEAIKRIGVEESA